MQTQGSIVAMVCKVKKHVEQILSQQVIDVYTDLVSDIYPLMPITTPVTINEKIVRLINTISKKYNCAFPCWSMITRFMFTLDSQRFFDNDCLLDSISLEKYSIFSGSICDI